MPTEDPTRPRQDGHIGGNRETCKIYLAEGWMMSEDVGYMGDELDWACGSNAAASSAKKSSNWLGWAGMIVGALALGTALWAAFAPHSLVEETSSRVNEALSRTARRAKEKAERVKEKAEHVKEKAEHVREKAQQVAEKIGANVPG
jgi:hypothetical protein